MPKKRCRHCKKLKAIHYYTPKEWLRKYDCQRICFKCAKEFSAKRNQ